VSLLASTSRRIGDKSLMTSSILGLPCLAGDLGDWHRAALLHGAAQALLGCASNTLSASRDYKSRTRSPRG
jgi:hypothetical protein